MTASRARPAMLAFSGLWRSLALRSRCMNRRFARKAAPGWGAREREPRPGHPQRHPDVDAGERSPAAHLRADVRAVPRAVAAQPRHGLVRHLPHRHGRDPLCPHPLRPGARQPGSVGIWQRFYDEFWRSPIFGRGIGSAFITRKPLELLYAAPHNEYLHLLVVGGARDLFSA